MKSQTHIPDRRRIRRRLGRRKVALIGALLVVITGCGFIENLHTDWPSADGEPYLQAATAIEYPNMDCPVESTAISTVEPVMLTSDAEPQYRDISLQEVIQLGLSRSKIMRDMGGLVLRTPQVVNSTFDVALIETDPRFGIEAALSEFDAQLSTSVTYEHNDRPLNNLLQAGQLPFRQKTAAIQTQIMKRTAVGGEVFLRGIKDYDRNNGTANFSPEIWEPMIEAGFRQSLLRGAGVDINRIAGGSRTPGIYNGVLIARTNADISMADFEIGVRNYVSDLENAYWDLYFAYRDLDAKIDARDAALETWRRANVELEAGRDDGSREAQALEQYYRFEEDVQNALTGRLTESTHTYNGSAGGTFRRTGGVHVAERRLRYLLDMPINEGVLLRPMDEPIDAPIVFDWSLSVSESLANRSELRRQKWHIKQRELELIAARNFLKPELDIVGLYRWRGFGRSLLDPDGGPDPVNAMMMASPFDDATTTLMNGDFQEWQLGLELSIPIGYRRAHAGVKNAEFRLARERAMLEEQEQLIMRTLSDAYADVVRGYEVLQTVTERFNAAQRQVDMLAEAVEADQQPFYLLLDAQRRRTQAQSRYYEALVEYGLAIKNMHYEKGSLLEYAGIHLAEGSWSRQAHEDALERLEHRVPVDDFFVPDHRVITSPSADGIAHPSP